MAATKEDILNSISNMTVMEIVDLVNAEDQEVPHAVMMMIPEPWSNHESMDDDKRAFYQYHSSLMEPWDGPASIAFTDGRQIGATLDRNGLRPSRYCVTDDDLVVMASESGVLPMIPENKIVKKWRLQPGKMFLIDFEQGRIIDDEELKNQFALAKPYRQWIENVRVNPFLLTLEATRFRLEGAGERPTLAFDRLFADFELSGFFGSPWTFSLVRLESPAVALEIDPCVGVFDEAAVHFHASGRDPLAGLRPGADPGFRQHAFQGCEGSVAGRRFRDLFQARRV